LLVIAGEIDCRKGEGIHRAFTKNKYNSLQECMIDTIRLYLEGLIKISVEFDTQIFVHPVRPPFIKGKKKKNCAYWEQQKSILRNELKQTPAEMKSNDISSLESLPVTCPLTCKRTPRLFSDIDKIQSVYSHAILIRDFNVELRKQIEMLQNEQLSALYIKLFPSSTFVVDHASTRPSICWLDIYTELCSRYNGPDCHYDIRYTKEIRMESENELFGSGDGSEYLLKPHFTLEGLHLNEKYTPILANGIHRTLQQTNGLIPATQVFTHEK
jgi:hypothetical protein